MSNASDELAGAAMSPGAQSFSGTPQTLTAVGERDADRPSRRLGTEARFSAQIHAKRKQIPTIEVETTAGKNPMNCRDYAAVREIPAHD